MNVEGFVVNTILWVLFMLAASSLIMLVSETLAAIVVAILIPASIIYEFQQHRT